MNKPWVKVLRWVGYGLFFVLALVLCVRFTFPTDQVREFAKAQIAQRLGAERVEIADIGISGLFPNGGSLEGLEIDLPPVKVKTAERGVDVLGPPRTLVAEELSVSGSLLGLASGNYDLEFEGKVQGGEITGGSFVWEKGGPLAAEIAAIKGLEIGSEGLFQTFTGFDVIATLNGKLKADIPAVDKDGKSVLQLDQLTGALELELTDAKILQPIFDTVMSREPVRMSFTDTKLGTVTIKLKAEGGAAAAATGAAPTPKGGKARGDATVLQIEEISATGGDIEIALAPKATITMIPGQSLKDAIINVHLAIKINDAWFDTEVKDPKDPTKMTKPNVGLRTMMTLGPLKAHVQDGQFGVGITGPLGKPKVVPERPRTRIGSGGAAIGGGRKINVDHPAGEGEDDEEAPKPRTNGAESKAKPIAAPGGTVPLERPPNKPSVARPAAMGKAAPGGQLGGQLGRPRPKLINEPGEAPEPIEEPLPVGGTHDDSGAVEPEPDPGNGGMPPDMPPAEENHD